MPGYERTFRRGLLRDVLRVRRLDRRPLASCVLLLSGGRIGSHLQARFHTLLGGGDLDSGLMLLRWCQTSRGLLAGGLGLLGGDRVGSRP